MTDPDRVRAGTALLDQFYNDETRIAAGEALTEIERLAFNDGVNTVREQIAKIESIAIQEGENVLSSNELVLGCLIPPPKKEWKHSKLGITVRISKEAIEKSGGLERLLRNFPGLEVVEE